MTFETAKVLELLIHHKDENKPLTLTELVNESLISEYGRVERILKTLSSEGYISALKPGNGETYMFYNLEEKARECIFDLKAKRKQWWENNFVGIISLILSAIIVICTIVQTIYGIINYHNPSESTCPYHHFEAQSDLTD